MFGKLGCRFVVCGLLLVSQCASAHASPKCAKDLKPFALSGDTINWTMSVAPGSECIQGLRWSYMQIYSVLISKPPKNGRIVILGSGFRYVADTRNDEPDTFTLVVSGKNRHDLGESILEIAVSGS
jgi:hypothetical protein